MYAAAFFERIKSVSNLTDDDKVKMNLFKKEIEGSATHLWVGSFANIACMGL